MSAASSHARHLAEVGRLANEIRLSVEQVSYANAPAADLVFIAGSDTAAGGADGHAVRAPFR